VLLLFGVVGRDLVQTELTEGELQTILRPPDRGIVGEFAIRGQPTDDVGVNMLGKMEAHRKAARGGTLRVVVCDDRLPAKSEKRTVTGVEPRCTCGARVSEAASLDGVNVPLSRMPFACAGLTPRVSLIIGFVKYLEGVPAQC
jgi:hypothetical protein